MGGPGTQGQTLLSLSVVQVRGPELGPFATLPQVGTFVNHLEIFLGGHISRDACGRYYISHGNQGN